MVRLMTMKKDIRVGVLFFVWFWLAKTAQKKQPISQLLFCRSGPTRTGDRLHPMQEC